MPDVDYIKLLPDRIGWRLLVYTQKASVFKTRSTGSMTHKASGSGVGL